MNWAHSRRKFHFGYLSIDSFLLLLPPVRGLPVEDNSISIERNNEFENFCHRNSISLNFVSQKKKKKREEKSLRRNSLAIENSEMDF